MSWIDEVLDEVQEGEAPTNYFWWSALAVLSAIVGRKVFIRKRKLFKIYPNLFIFLISKKSGLGKGFPVSVAEKLVVKLGNSRVILGQASIEGIIKELSQAFTTPSGRIISTAEAFLISGEFGAFLLENPKLFTQLTDLYDSMYHDDWGKLLATQDKSKLKDICISGLFAANEVHFNEALPMHAKKGGFLGRVITVYESQRRKLEPAMRIKPGMKDDIDYERLLKPLTLIAQTEGEFTLCPNALDMYETWYHQFYGRENTDDTGTAERMRDNVLKVGMLLSLADEPTLEIKERNMSEAILKCTQSLASTKNMIFGEGKADKARESKRILGLLIEAPNHVMTRKDLLIRGHGDFDVNDLDRVMDTFVQAKLVKSNGSGSNQSYWLTEECLSILKKGDENETGKSDN